MPSPVEQIKARLSAADLVGSYLKLQKVGANFRALCPFHSEKTPSFYVSPARDIWHCFGCSRGGDIFGFVMEIEGVEFPEALKILAQRAGVELKREDPRLRNERIRLLELLEAASEFYTEELKKYPEVVSYLKSRGLKNSTISHFKLGFAPGPPAGGWQNLYSHLKNRGYADDEIEKAGMSIKSQKSNLPPAVAFGDSRWRASKSQISYYDRFRSRIMFPLADSTGRIVGFSGRIFPAQGGSASGGESEGKPAFAEASAGKYINTPQTILYDKSRLLYGFDKAKTEIRKKDACILVEGQMDVLMCHQTGTTNAVAISGTALTHEHLRALSRLTKNLILAFDKDEAGLLATKRGVDTALKSEFEIRVIDIKSGKDPADLIKENPQEWQKAAAGSSHIIDFYLDVLSQKHKDPRLLKREAGREVLPLIAAVPNQIEKSHWVSEVARRLNIKEEPVWEELKKIKPEAKREEKPFEGPEVKRSRCLLLEQRILGIAFLKKESRFLQGKENIFSLASAPLLLKLKKNIKGRFLSENELKALQGFAFEAELVCQNTQDMEGEITSLTAELQKEFLKSRLEELAQTIKNLEEKGEGAELEKSLKEFKEISKKLY